MTRIIRGLRLARRGEGVARQLDPRRPAARQRRLGRRRVEGLAVQVVDQVQRRARIAPPQQRGGGDEQQQQRHAAGGVGADVAQHQALDMGVVAGIDGAPRRHRGSPRRQQQPAAAHRQRRIERLRDHRRRQCRQCGVEPRAGRFAARLVVPHHRAIAVEHPEAADAGIDTRRVEGTGRQLRGDGAATLLQGERGGGADRTVGAGAPGHGVAEHQRVAAAAAGMARDQRAQRLRHVGRTELGEQLRAAHPGVDPQLGGLVVDVVDAPERAAPAGDQAGLLREQRGLLDRGIAPAHVAALRPGQQHLRRALAQHCGQRVERVGARVGGGGQRVAVDHDGRRDRRRLHRVAQAQQVVAQRREHGVQPRHAAVGAHRDLPLRADRDDLELQHQHVAHRRQHRQREQQHQQRVAAAQTVQCRIRHRLREGHVAASVPVT